MVPELFLSRLWWLYQRALFLAKVTFIALTPVKMFPHPDKYSYDHIYKENRNLCYKKLFCFIYYPQIFAVEEAIMITVMEGKEEKS